MSDYLSWMPWRRERREAEAARQRDLLAIAAECERLAGGADDTPTRLAYERAAEAAHGLAAAPAIGEGGVSLVSAQLPSDAALADEQHTVRELIEARGTTQSPADEKVLIAAAVITGVAAVAVASNLGWGFGRAAFAVGAAIAAVILGGRTRRRR